MAGVKELTHDSYIRELSFTLRQGLSLWLDPQKMWQTLAAHIPSNPDILFSERRTLSDRRYMAQNFFAFEMNPSPTKALLLDWGVDNCQIKHLIKALLDVGYVAAAKLVDEACVSSNQGRQPDDVGEVRKCEAGSSLDVVVQVEKLQLNGNNPPPKMEEMDFSHHVSQLSFGKLDKITDHFNEKDTAEGGRLLGVGGFGCVYLGEYLETNGSDKSSKVAVKRLKNTDEESLKQFETELKTLQTYQHENLVVLLGYSSDGPFPCLVYQYIENGSLQDRLECLNHTIPLSVPLRLSIATGTATGIEYLHSKGVTHRDIKTANILLDSEFTAKVSDFATARTLPKSEDFKTQFLQTGVIIGSKSYLAPEAYDFKIHPGLDIFSFGVVLLELLTGLPVFDSRRDDEDLKIHVKEHCTPDEDSEDEDGEEKACGTILDLVDRGTGVVWNTELVNELYTLSQQCLEHSVKKRKKINFVLSKLKSMKAE